MGVSNLSSGDTISFSDINDELGNSSTATLDMQTAGDSFSGINTDGVYSITEFYGVSDASPAFSSFAAAGNASTTGRIDISWGTSGPINTFLLKRATNSDMDANVASVSSTNDGSESDTGLSNTTTDGHASASPGKYFYQAIATNTDPDPNNVTNSSVVSGLLLPTVTSPSATANTGIGGRIDLAWTNNGTITQVLVKRATNSGMSAGLATILTDTSAAFATTFADTSQTGQKYYQVHITNATGTTLSSVVNATATSATARTIEQNLNWGADGETNEDIKGWATSELILCVEDTNSATEPSFGSDADGAVIESTTTYALTTTSGGWNNLSVAKQQSDGTTVFNGGARFFRNDTDSKIHQIAANGAISNTISYTPVALVLSEVSKTTSQVVVRATGDTRVAKTLKFYKDGSLIVTKTDHTKGSSGNTSVTYDYTFTGLASSTAFAFKVNSSNAEASSGTDSNTLSVTTSGGATTWSSVPADFNLYLAGNDSSSDTELSSALTINLANGTGNTTISCQQPSGTPALQVAVSTSSDPGSGGSFATSQTVAAASAYYLRFKLVEGGNNNDLSAVDRTITFTNNSVSNTALQISCRIINVGR
jgi:hypothetical protein